MFMKRMFAVTLTATVLGQSIAYAGPEAEVLHWWTSGGEAKSVAVLQKEFSENGGTWTDMPVAGGGGDAAMTALRARVLSGALWGLWGVVSLMLAVPKYGVGLFSRSLVLEMGLSILGLRLFGIPTLC